MALSSDADNLYNPLLCTLQRTKASQGEDEEEEDEGEEDIVTLVQKQSHHPLNVVFDYEAFSFGCIIGQYDISAPFNDYYEEAIALPYDHNTFQDFL